MSLARASLGRQLGQMPPTRHPETHFGTVVSVQTGPPKTITVTLNGGSTNLTVRYLASYTPTVGDHCLLLLLGSDNRAHQSWLAIDALA